jgi:hypothetical protein
VTNEVFWGAPQCGHCNADSCNSFPQPRQKIIENSSDVDLKILSQIQINGLENFYIDEV